MFNIQYSGSVHEVISHDAGECVLTRKFDLIGIGVLFEDLLFDVRQKHHITREFEHDHLSFVCVEAGSKTGVMRFTRATGGSSANLICGVSRLGDYRLGYFAKLGVDPVSKWLIEDLQNFRVDTDGIVISNDKLIGPGASAIITDSSIRDRSILMYRGISDEIYVSDVRAKENYLSNSEWHTISSFSNSDAIEALNELIDIERRNGIKLFFTPSMSMINPLLDDAIEITKQSTLMSLNDTEARVLTGTKDLRKAAAKLQSLGPEFVLITRGKEGLLGADNRKFYEADQTYGTEVRNTVGAGDVSGAALWHFLRKGLDKPSVMQRILAAGAMKVRFVGAKMGQPTEKEIDQFIQENGSISVKVEDK
jgi:sugar/nucleoside kinase (ribokinase family)